MYLWVTYQGFVSAWWHKIGAPHVLRGVAIIIQLQFFPPYGRWFVAVWKLFQRLTDGESNWNHLSYRLFHQRDDFSPKGEPFWWAGSKNLVTPAILPEHTGFPFFISNPQLPCSWNQRGFSGYPSAKRNHCWLLLTVSSKTDTTVWSEHCTSVPLLI